MTKNELLEKYRQAVMGLRFLASSTDDNLVHEILDETFEAIGEPKFINQLPGDGPDGQTKPPEAP